MKAKVDGKEYTVLSEEDLTNAEVMAIEKVTGDPISTWAKGSMSLITGLVWVTMKRENPQLRYNDVVFTMADLTVDDEELDEDGQSETEGKEDEESESSSSKTK